MAAEQLEASVQQSPAALLSDGSVATLGRLYNLMSPSLSAASRRRLTDFAASHEGLDLSLLQP